MLENIEQEVSFFAAQTQMQLPILETIVEVLFGVWALNLLLGGRLNLLGIHPRKLWGLPGIVCAPFLHAGFNHLFFNLIPLLVLSDFLLVQGVNYFCAATVFITVVSGALVWCFGKPGIHLGASGVITGYWALLVLNIFTQGGFLTIALGVLSLYYFAGIFFGIFPVTRGVSWEGHFFGLLAGLLFGYLPML